MAAAKNGEKQETAVSASFNPITFLGESWEELRKVHTPTRQETVMITIRVLALILLFGVFLGLADLVVGRIMSSILT